MIVDIILVKLYLLDVCPWIEFLRDNKRQLTDIEYNSTLINLHREFSANNITKAIIILNDYLVESKLYSSKKLSRLIKSSRKKARLDKRARFNEKAIEAIDSEFSGTLTNIEGLNNQELKPMILYSAMRYGLLLNKDFKNV